MTEMNKNIKKLLAILLSAVVIVSGCTVAFGADKSAPASAAVSTTGTDDNNAPSDSDGKKDEAKKSLEEQRKDIEKHLADSEKKLSEYNDSAKETEEYIDALDEKIGYMNEELSVLDKEISAKQKKVSTLDKQIKTLKSELAKLTESYEKNLGEYNSLNEKFNTTYEAYCLRLRAMYISGSDSIWVALLTSKDISQFLSRYEMIKAVSKSDTELLEEVNSEIDQIMQKQTGLDSQKKDLTEKNNSLVSKQKQYKSEKASVESKQQELANKKVVIAQDRAESDRLLAKYAQKTQMYGEFMNEDEEIIKKIDAENEALIKGLKDPSEVTTAKADYKKVTYSTTASKDNALFVRSNGALAMGYPVPGHTWVSSPFGKQRATHVHKGTDFPCPTGSKVVAAQKGIVIKTVRRTDSYGYYVMIYHGTDKKGRKVVTLYAHNSSILVSTGQTVKKGQQIAKSGSTGNSTGPHCHFEVILDGTKVNSAYYTGK